MGVPPGFDGGPSAGASPIWFRPGVRLAAAAGTWHCYRLDAQWPDGSWSLVFAFGR